MSYRCVVCNRETNYAAHVCQRHGGNPSMLRKRLEYQEKIKIAEDALRFIQTCTTCASIANEALEKINSLGMKEYK